MSHFLVCPEPACEAPAEVIDEFTLPSTSGPTAMVRTFCVQRHIFMLPFERVSLDIELDWAPVRSM
jgi:hypothetical protein